VHCINLRSKLVEEMELAVELFQVTSEAELEQFLGNLFKKSWRGIKAVRSSITRRLGEVLKTVAKTALPFSQPPPALSLLSQQAVPLPESSAPL
jgi:hypothetical protein